MSGLKVHWIELNYLILILFVLFKKFFVSYIIKKEKFFFFLDIFNYFFSFNFIQNNNIVKINTIIDMSATHYIDHENEFELLYVGLCYKYNFRFFLKIFSSKEDLLISLNNIYDNIN
jgi:NADH:ubiquinone oxidoreductase subunit C